MFRSAKYFVATKRCNREYVTGTDVLHFLIESNQIHAKLDDFGKYEKSIFLPQEEQYKSFK